MKKIFFLLMILSITIFPQSWNAIVTTTINESTSDKMDLFTNKDGNHLLIKRTNGNIVYYNFNSSGTVDASKTETLVSSGDFPNIVGSNDVIYALYKSGSYIKGKYSTNGGDTWTTLPHNNYIGSNTCNGIDAVFDDSGVHVVWATKDSDPDYEAYYEKIRLTDYNWVDFKTVTDYNANEVGGFPTVAVSSNRVHVSYNTGNGSTPYTNIGDAKTRDKYYSSWQAPKPVTQGDEESGREKVQVRTTTLYDFYYEPWVDLGQYGYHLIVKTKPISSENWSGHTQLDTYTADPWPFMGAEQTADNNLNIVYFSDDVMNHRSFDGTNWSDPFEITNDFLYYTNLGYSTVSNDLFVSWKPQGSNYIKYRQYDAAPLAPQNLTVSQSGNNHPLLNWSANQEPDINN